MKKRRNKKHLSIFAIFTMGYALFAFGGIGLMRHRVDEAIISLILFGSLSIAIAAWIVDAIRFGEMWRQGPRSVTSSLTMNEQRITRKMHPFKFWLMISLSIVFALSILIFSVVGIYLRLIMNQCPVS